MTRYNVAVRRVGAAVVTVEAADEGDAKAWAKTIASDPEIAWMNEIEVLSVVAYDPPPEFSGKFSEQEKRIIRSCMTERESKAVDAKRADVVRRFNQAIDRDKVVLYDNPVSKVCVRVQRLRTKQGKLQAKVLRTGSWWDVEEENLRFEGFIRCEDTLPGADPGVRFQCELASGHGGRHRNNQVSWAQEEDFE